MVDVPADAKPDLDMNLPFRSSVPNFYVSDCITRASPTMAKCTEAFVNSD